MCSWPLALSSECLLKQSYAGICSERKDCNGQAAEESWKTDHVAHLAGQGMKRRPEGPVNGEGPVYKDFLRALCSEQSVWKLPEPGT